MAQVDRSRLSKKIGNGFEAFFYQAAVRSGVSCIRFPDGCRRIPGLGGKPRLIPEKTPFDWILSVQGKAAFIDTKSTEGKSFPHSKIEEHQLDALLGLERHGHPAGYVVNFQKLGLIVFFRATTLAAIGPRESLKPENGTQIGDRVNFNARIIFSPMVTPEPVDPRQLSWIPL